MEPFPRTIILQPVYCSNSFAVIPRGPNIRPTKLNCKMQYKYDKAYKDNRAVRKYCEILILQFLFFLCICTIKFMVFFNDSPHFVDFNKYFDVPH